MVSVHDDLLRILVDGHEIAIIVDDSGYTRFLNHRWTTQFVDCPVICKMSNQVAGFERCLLRRRYAPAVDSKGKKQSSSSLRNMFSVIVSLLTSITSTGTLIFGVSLISRCLADEDHESQN